MLRGGAPDVSAPTSCVVRPGLLPSLVVLPVVMPALAAQDPAALLERLRQPAERTRAAGDLKELGAPAAVRELAALARRLLRR